MTDQPTAAPRHRLDRYGENTRLVLAGRAPDEQHGFVNTPAFRGSTVLSPTVADLMGHTGRYTYGRRGTPTSEAFETALLALEGGGADGVVLCPSGLSACVTALFSCLRPGDHLLMTDSVYGPVRHFVTGALVRAGIETSFYDPMIGAGVAGLIRPSTRAVYLEAPGSQTFEVQDVPAIAAAARAAGALALMDNTWATPLLFRPHEHGVDLSIQAGTKYLGGHSDIMLGSVSASERAWPALKAWHGDTGLCVGPDDLFLGLRGLRTLGPRLERHGANGLAVARWLSGRPEVARVLHPALPGCPGHETFLRDFKGASGLFSIVLRPAPRRAVAEFLDGLDLFGLGYSWGGYESLAVPFDPKAIRTATTWTEEGPCVRFHIGLEDVADLVADLEAGLERFGKVS